MSDKAKSAKAAKEAAANAREAARAAERAHERKIRLIVGAAVVVVVGLLAAIPLYAGLNQGPNTDANAALPTGVTSDTYGVKIGPAWTDANAESIPMLQIWEDFQCPACAKMEMQSGIAIVDLAKQGKIRLEYRPTIFLDQNLKNDNLAAGNPDSSLAASMAFGCAVDAGKGQEFHTSVFINQPATEGEGFSSDKLSSIAETVGIEGDALTTFNECLSSKKYESWVNNSYDAFSKEGVTSTPTAFLNGKELTGEVLFDPAALTAAIEDAAAAQ